MTDARTHLREKVARALCSAADDDWDWSVFYIVDANDTAETGRDVYRAMADAAIAVALEEAARVVTENYQSLAPEYRMLLVNRAAAIRALKTGG